MGLEFEYKYAADPAILAQLRQAFPAPEQVLYMHTTYYDTPGGALAARRWTLRRRMENEESICTLKTPAQGQGRQEWEVSCGSIDAAISELCKLGAPESLSSLVQDGLVAVCEAKFTRIAKTLQVMDTQLELALDEGFLCGNGRTLPLCEVEVEYKSGSIEVCTAFSRSLAAQYQLKKEPLSKFRRALSLAKGEAYGCI